MNYKQKYEEALERARKINSGEGVAVPPDWTTCEVIFPELRESEDEKIRKELIERFNWELKGAEEQDSAGCNRQKDIAMFKRGIAWLEKQGDTNKWKPSEDEMGALYGLAYLTNKMDDKKDEAITKLYQDLKREFFNGASYENMFPSSPVDAPIKDEKQGEMKSDINDNILLRFAFYQYDDDTLYLSSVFVEECNRKRGYGSKILKAAEEVAKTFGISKIRLKVESNSWMEEWYKRNGYEYLTSEGKYDWLEKQCEQKPYMIQWKGNNLKEIVEFTGISPEFNNWFKSWDEFESYVHSHNDIFKLFFQDGSHYEVPKGAWIVRTPEGHGSPTIEKTKEYSQKLIDLARKELEENYYTKVLDDGMVFKSKLHATDLQTAYDMGKQDALKDLPKWKKATEHKDLEKHVAILEEGKVLLSNYLEEGDYYIKLEDLKSLPKEG